MRAAICRRAVAALALATVVWMPLPVGRAQQTSDDDVTLEGDLVLVPVAVRKEKGGVVTDLRKEELRLADQGVDESIEFFSRDTAPVDVVLLVDSSGSVEGLLDVIQTAAYAFVKALRPEDSFSIVTFAERPVIRLGWSNDVKAAAAALRTIEPEGSTTLYGSVVAVSYELFQQRPTDHRRAVIVLSDGDDTLSSVTSRTAARAALMHDVSVYVVSIGRIMIPIFDGYANNRTVPLDKRMAFRESASRLRRAEERLDYMTDQTGGRALYPQALQDLSKAYAEIADEIRSRYLVGYYPPDEAHGFRTITVTTSRKGVRIHARQGYFR